jgi:chromosome segregation ATPase
MSEDRTAETKDARSFEDRVFARFDVVEIRIGKLEDRQYDTKPIWERALAAIVETNRTVRETNERMNTAFAQMQHEFKAIHSRLDVTDKRFDAMDQRFDAMDQRFDAMDQRFDAMDQRFDAMDKRFDAMDKRFDAMDQRFDKQDMDSEHNLRKVKRSIDALNLTLSEIHVDQRYVDSRLEKIEERVFPDESN